MKSNIIAWVIAVGYPAIHQLLPLVMKRLREPVPEEKGAYAAVYDVLSWFAAGNGGRK